MNTQTDTKQYQTALKKATVGLIGDGEKVFNSKDIHARFNDQCNRLGFYGLSWVGFVTTVRESKYLEFDNISTIALV